MIYSKEKIITATILVRFYYYEDVYKGCGDKGTFKYLQIPIEYFSEMKEDSMFKYKLNFDLITKVLYDGWWINLGYQLGIDQVRLDEIDKLKAEIEKLSYIEIIY